MQENHTADQQITETKQYASVPEEEATSQTVATEASTKSSGQTEIKNSYNLLTRKEKGTKIAIIQVSGVHDKITP